MWTPTVILLQGPILLIYASMGPGHESTVAWLDLRYTTIPFLTLIGSQKLLNKLYTVIAHYRRSLHCPICTSVPSPKTALLFISQGQNLHTSQITNIHRSLASCVYISVFWAKSRSRAGWWVMISRRLGAPRVFSTVCCQQRNSSRRSQILPSFSGSWRRARHMLWEPSTQTRSPPFVFVRSNLIKMASVGV